MKYLCSPTLLITLLLSLGTSEREPHNVSAAGQAVMEYAGEVVTQAECKRREEEYKQTQPEVPFRSFRFFELPI